MLPVKIYLKAHLLHLMCSNHMRQIVFCQKIIKSFIAEKVRSTTP